METTIEKHADSHLDHDLTDAQIAFALAQPAKAGEITVQTVEFVRIAWIGALRPLRAGHGIGTA